MNCWQDYTGNAVLEQISRDLVGAALPRSSSTGRLIDRITTDLNGPGVVILDERVISRISVADAEREVRQKTISKLNTHQRALYEVLAEEDGLIQKELYARYQETHDDPVTLRYLRENHLPKLDHYNLVDIEQDRGSKRYHNVEVDHPTPTSGS